MDELCVVVKKAKRIPPELLPLVIFDENLWLCWFLAGFVIAGLWSALRFLNNAVKRPSTTVADKIRFYIDDYNLSPFLAHQSAVRQYCQLFVDTWLMFLSIPIRRFTRIQNERIFISTICLSSIIFLSMYQSGLATVFVKPLYFKDITSLTQLDQSGQSILVKYAGYLSDVFPNDSSTTYMNLRRKMLLTETDQSSMDIVKDGDRTSTITRKSTVFLDNSIYFMRKQLHLVDKECPRNYFLAYMVAVHSTYLERINEILFDIQRYGFIQQWIDEINYQNTLINMRNFVDESAATPKILTLEDLKFPFELLIVGSALGVVCIGIELLVECIQARRRKSSRYAAAGSAGD